MNRGRGFSARKRGADVASRQPPPQSLKDVIFPRRDVAPSSLLAVHSISADHSPTLISIFSSDAFAPPLRAAVHKSIVSSFPAELVARDRLLSVKRKRIKKPSRRGSTVTETGVLFKVKKKASVDLAASAEERSESDGDLSSAPPSSSSDNDSDDFELTI